MSVFYGLGNKLSIMGNFHGVLSGVTGQQYVDYQRNYDSGIGPEKMPGFFVNDLRDERELILADVVKHNLTVGVVGWVRAGDGENLWPKLNDWANKAIHAIMADPSRGGQAYETQITAYETDSGSRHPVGVYIMIITVIFFTAE
jgi:hypothetical protein